MGATGSPHATFQRALARRNLTVAKALARELPLITLADALALTLLILERDPPRYSTAAARWAARFALEVTPPPPLEEMQLPLAGLSALGTQGTTAVGVVSSICLDHGLSDCGAVVSRLAAD